jgi:hypothetical protein
VAGQRDAEREHRWCRVNGGRLVPVRRSWSSAPGQKEESMMAENLIDCRGWRTSFTDLTENMPCSSPARLSDG